MPSAPIQRVIDPERELQDHVELIAVDNAIATPLRCRMHNVLVDFDAAETQADVAA